jgi:hypothetical protein
MVINIIMHSIVCLLSFYLFILFAYWWNKKLNILYKYTCFVWFGMAVTNLGAVWLYSTKFYLGDNDLGMFVPTFWPYRHLVTIIPLALYARYVTKKIYCSGDHPGRRDDDL